MSTRHETPQALDLDRYLPALVTWVNNKYASDSSRIYRKYFGIGIADWRVLAYLGVKGTGTGAQMSDFLGMDKAAISRSLQFLGSLGCVELAEQQGRRSVMRLSGPGVRLYNEVLQIALKREEVLMKGLSDQDRETLFKLLHRVHENMADVMEMYRDDA
ncbi:MarR family winged helix-turn-helix transcriptional regulator [Mesobacterium pallidum]|uniref:MarR family winged helix-turn-helix transcriptional regulator n=1 Tax=Mesobacterium pallidum TaxID=2872037 RepID=UPI001EE17256|nr:MarR family winged helix-turn-helix transcriptional regulator [Mesobacterium pallidum]